MAYCERIGKYSASSYTGAVCLSVFGIIFPVFSYIFGTLLILDMIAISMLISICTFIVFSISDVMKKEVSVAEKYLVY